jgi:dihydroxyacetone kinase-like predicted kinase
VVTGLVSTAIRDTKGQGVQVHAGDYIGFVSECIYAADPVRERAALQLCEAVGTGNYDVLLLLGGSAVPEDEAEALRQKLEQANPLTEVIRLSGGQPIFDYIMIFE